MSLPRVLEQGLTAVCIFAFLSLVLSATLVAYLAYHLIKWKRGTHSRLNQFVILIFNLLLADLQQSTAFVLNAEWIRLDNIVVETRICFAQGWFVSVGDLASGVFTFAIAMHCFADIVHDYRMDHTRFILSIVGLWSFVYTCTIIGLAMHPDEFYTRAGAWCWVNAKYTDVRLWLHYFWILVAEFGTLIIYSLILIIVRKRIRDGFYGTSEMRYRAQTAARLVVVYPLVYLVCTLPLVVARLKTMAGAEVTFLELTIAGAMITSNGWLDALLYSLTRRALLFGPGLTSENVRALEAFNNTNTNWRADSMFGNTTTIEATHPITEVQPSHQKRGSRSGSLASLHSYHLRRYSNRMHGTGRRPSVLPSIFHATDSFEDLFGAPQKKEVKTETVVEVTRTESMVILPIDPVHSRACDDVLMISRPKDSFEMSTTSRGREAISPGSKPDPSPWEDVVLGEWPKENPNGKRWHCMAAESNAIDKEAP